MNRQQRLKFLNKLGQAAAPTSATTTTTPTSPTPTVSNNTTTIAKPTQFDIWSAYPDPCKAYNSQQLQIINNLVTRLSTAVNQLTAGKYNFQKLKDANFVFDPSEFSDPNTKYLMLFFGKVFKFLLNNGVAFPSSPIPPQQLKNNIASLTNAPELSMLGQVSQTGAVANLMSGNNNMFQTIKNTLLLLTPVAT
jgi:hypothetical protein